MSSGTCVLGNVMVGAFSVDTLVVIECMYCIHDSRVDLSGCPCFSMTRLRRLNGLHTPFERGATRGALLPVPSSLLDFDPERSRFYRPRIVLASSLVR